MNIGWAVAQLYGGRRVRRAGWNGKGMALALQVPDSASKMTLPYVYLEISSAGQLTARIPWNCSQADLLGTDWEDA